VLLVDNSPVNVKLMKSTLEPCGYEVLAAAGVAEGLALARREPPDLILSDVHMPGEDGFDFIRAVKVDPLLASIPFIFLSSTVWGRLDEEQGLALGAEAFIRRPIATMDLLARVRALLARPAEG
jgi:CheY-like chemotaxis protein